MSNRSILQSITDEKIRHLLCQASVSLDVLKFPYSRPLDQAHVERLKTTFGGGRCLPQRDEYHIPAIVDESVLKKEWFQDENGIKYLNPPEGFELQCLRGQHRAAAARGLVYGEKRWMVDIYSSGMSLSV